MREFYFERFIVSNGGGGIDFFICIFNEVGFWVLYFIMRNIIFDRE